jgi:rubrerythrin
MADTKIIQNKEFDEKALGSNYARIILKGIKSATTEGMSVGEMKDACSLIEKIELNMDAETIEVTDIELLTILEKTRAIKWVVFSKELIEMDDYLGSL